MPLEVTYETIVILIAFITVVFLIYKAFKLALKGILIAIASFSFPWVVKFLNLNLPITADIQTGIQFALLGIVLFLIYESAHTIIKILKIITWPIRTLFKRRK